GVRWNENSQHSSGGCLQEMGLPGTVDDVSTARSEDLSV
ncbi:MAG: hypothetical protein ACJAQ3_003398, partial [Planctomycetota bacterium]